MLGDSFRRQDELVMIAGLRKLIPDDDILVRVDKAVDFSWVREKVKELYCEDNGRPSIDPESAMRLMVAGFFEGIVHDRKLMRAAQVNVAIRWFAGFGLEDELPHHSSLTRIRERWGEEVFLELFEQAVRACVEAGLVDCGALHVDATLIHADVSWESLAVEHAEQVIAENEEEVEEGGGRRPGEDRPKRPGRSRTGRAKKRSRTDPDATLSTSRSDQRLEPSYKQHTAVEGRSGVVLDVELTTGEASEGARLLGQIRRVEKRCGAVEAVSADGAYGTAANYHALEERGTAAVIPPPRAALPRSKRFPLSRFAYDAKHKLVRCPAGKHLRPAGRGKEGRRYRGSARMCGSCRLRHRCVSPKARYRTVLIVDGYESLLRARRRRNRWGPEDARIYRRHRWRVEGVHGEAKERHGLRRAVRRGLANVTIQVYLTAAVINLKRLAVWELGLYLRLRCRFSLVIRDRSRIIVPAALKVA